MDDRSPPVRTRVCKSPEARTVARVLHEYAARGVFHDLRESDMRIGRMIFRMLWGRDTPHRFVVDLEACELSVPGLLPGIAADSAAFKAVRAFLRNATAGEAHEQLRVDGGKGELRLFARHGAVTLSMAVKQGEYEYCTERLVQLADEMLRRFFQCRRAASGRAHDHVMLGQGLQDMSAAGI